MRGGSTWSHARVSLHQAWGRVMIRAATLSAILAVAMADATQASTPTTPEAIVRGVYAGFIAQNDQFAPPYQPSERFYSPRLKALVAAARKQANGEAACGLDFMFWVDAQDYDVKSVDVSLVPAPDANTQIVVAAFTNIRQAEEIRFTFRRIGGRWRLDDAEEVLGHRWVFSQLLRCKG